MEGCGVRPNRDEMVSPDSDLGVDAKRDLDENGQDGEGYYCVCPVHGGQRGVRSSSQSQYLSLRSFRRWWRVSALRII